MGLGHQCRFLLAGEKDENGRLCPNRRKPTEFTVLSAFQGHSHRFPTTAGTASKNPSRAAVPNHRAVDQYRSIGH